MTPRQIKSQQKKLRMKISVAKVLEEYAENEQHNCKMQLKVLTRRTSDKKVERMKAERELFEFEWKHDLANSPECTGTEY